jgi:SAM-dependent methyltransferase
MSGGKRKQKFIDIRNKFANDRLNWIKKNSYFHHQDIEYLRFLIPPNLKILNVNCDIGEQLAALDPSIGVGVSLSKEMVRIAKKLHPKLKFLEGDIENKDFLESLKKMGPFDIILLSDAIGSFDDCQKTLESLKGLCSKETRLVISYYNIFWDPILRFAEFISLKMPSGQQNYLSTEDIINLLHLSGFESIKQEWRQLIPKRLLGVGSFINKWMAPLPVLRRSCLRNYVIARLEPEAKRVKQLSTTVVIPCRNERGNIEAAIKRLPRFCPKLEILFVEGHSKDGTLAEIKRVIKAYSHYDIKVIEQPGKGKGDAVRAGFLQANNEVLIILDADLTTPPEDMPKFYNTLISGKGEFINGSRLIYPMENQAMQFLNLIANKVFSWLFCYILNQRFTDTLCGTKALKKGHYLKVLKNRSYFGEFDPFGDFDLIFGASKLNLKVKEIPVRYAARSYGSTQISRFTHGWLLLKMVVFAYKKFKAF